MDTIERADRLGNTRALLFVAIAGLLVINLIVGVGKFDQPSHFAGWTFMVALMALNLTSIGGRCKNANLRNLLNDEVVQMHRRMAVVTGFWVGLASMVATMFAIISDPALAIPALATAITATLVFPLLQFAFLELRAAR